MLVETDTADDSRLTLTIATGVSTSVLDVDGKEAILNSGDEIMVSVGLLTLKDLQDMGFIMPETYSQSNETRTANAWLSILNSIILIGGLALLFWWLYGGFLMGKVRKYGKSKSDISFADIGGISEVKESLMEAVSFLRDRRYLQRVGAQIPRGILLEGAPGTGKTMLAKAVAREANVPFFYTSASEFHDMWVGLAARRIRKLFKEAGKETSVIFIDELDAVAHRRTVGQTDAGREWNHTLNQLLSEMDGFTPNTKILVLAATNRPEVLDPAILRPGRFDRRIIVPLPNQRDRYEILRIHARGKNLSADINFDALARQTAGLSGADLVAVLNEAAIIAGRERSEHIHMVHIGRAIDKVLVGTARKNLTLSNEEKRTFAYHEAGHALVSFFLPEADKVQRISILPHGQAGGFTRLAPEKEALVQTKTKLLSSITVLLGGRAAEEIAVGDITSGAQDDIKKANALAFEMVAHYGMGKKFGLRYCERNEVIGVKEISSEASDTIDAEIESILGECYDRAKAVVNAHKDELEKVASKLLEVEAMSGEEITRLLG